MVWTALLLLALFTAMILCCSHLSAHRNRQQNDRDQLDFLRNFSKKESKDT